MTARPEMILFLSDARGVYIPRDFATSIKRDHVSGVDAETWSILESGPDHEWYWESWSSVTDNAIVTDDSGVKYRVYQDGDCWLIPEGMEWDDDSESFQWPEDRKHWFSTSSGLIELQMTMDQAESASHSGQCDDDVRELSKDRDIARQLAKLDPELLARELREYGAWDESELADHDKNLQRILWLAAGDIRDNATTAD